LRTTSGTAVVISAALSYPTFPIAQLLVAIGIAGLTIRNHPVSAIFYVLTARIIAGYRAAAGLRPLAHGHQRHNNSSDKKEQKQKHPG